MKLCSSKKQGIKLRKHLSNIIDIFMDEKKIIRHQIPSKSIIFLKSFCYADLAFHGNPFFVNICL